MAPSSANYPDVMFIYRTGELRSRLRLTDWDAFLLDCWLSLHSEETHPLLALRPIGLRTIADLAEGLNPTYDKALIAFLTAELPKLRQLDPVLPNPLPAGPIAHGNDLSQPVKDWLDSLRAPGVIASVSERVTKALLAQSGPGNQATTAFNLARLAAELAGQNRSARSLFAASKAM